MELNNDENQVAFSSLVERGKTDFLTFCYLIFPPKEEPSLNDIQIGKVHRLLCSIVQKVCDGEAAKYQAISLPPQHGKSTFLTILAVAWILGRRGGISVGISAFSSTLVGKFSRDIKAIIDTPIYQAIFPEMTMGRDNVDNIDEREWNNGSCLQCKTTGKKFTGRRIDWKVVDDPHAGREEAESKSQRDRVASWYSADVISRLAPEANVFIIATRWHPEDLIGFLTSEDREDSLRGLDQEDEIFNVTNLKALSEGEDNDPLGREEPNMALFPEVRNTRFLLGVKAGIPTYEWSSQYQGRPATSLGGEADVSKLTYIGMSDFEEIQASKGMELVRAWDLAVTEKQASDYTAGVLGCYDEAGDTLYLVDIFRNKATWVKNRHNIVFISTSDKDRWESQRLGIEAGSGFTALFQDIRQQLLGRMKVEKKIPTKASKLLRAHPWLHKVEAGRVVIVRGAWNKDFVGELAGFPDGAHDDMCDGLSILWGMISNEKRRGKKKRRSIRRRLLQ